MVSRSTKLNILSFKMLIESRPQCWPSSTLQMSCYLPKYTCLNNRKGPTNNFLNVGLVPAKRFLKTGGVPANKFLKTGGVPPNKFLKNGGVLVIKFLKTGGVPANKFLKAGGVQANKFLKAGGVPANNLLQKEKNNAFIQMTCSIYIFLTIIYCNNVYNGTCRVFQIKH
jgi:hypothetical protein